MITRLCSLVVVFGLTAGYVGYAMEPENVPLRVPFSQMESQAGRWRLESAPKLDPKIEAVLGVDDYVSRVYRASSADVASLYVGYYRTQREGDTIHSPMNCLPGAGWIPVDTRVVDIAIAGRPSPVRAKRVIIEKGLDRQVVLYWYQSHGRTIANEYESKVMMVYDAFRLNRSDAALVRVVTPVREATGGVQAADARAVDFVQQMVPQLESHLPS